MGKSWKRKVIKERLSFSGSLPVKNYDGGKKSKVDPETGELITDPFHYGRHKKAEQQRESEWVEKNRQTQLPIRDATIVILKPSAYKPTLQKPKKPNNSLNSYWPDNKRNITQLFPTLNSALDYANKISGRKIPHTAWRHKKASVFCALDVSAPSFASGYVPKTLRITITDTKTINPATGINLLLG